MNNNVNLAYLHELDSLIWAMFDAKIAAAADRAMIAVDAETVGLFKKYNVDMPATFARDTRWRKPNFSLVTT